MTQALEPRAELIAQLRAELIAQLRSDDFRAEVALALPEGMRPERFVRAAITGLLQNPDIVRAERASVYQSLLRCAQDGLLPDGREAALVLFKQKAVYMPMIGGYRKIAANHGWMIRTAVVHENDEFDYTLGFESRLVHVPVRPGSARGEAIGAYAVATHQDGRRMIEVMDVDEIETVRATSRAKDTGPWVEWWGRMAEKTVGRRLFAQLPLGGSEVAARVLATDGTEFDVLPARPLPSPSSGAAAVSEAGRASRPAGTPGREAQDADAGAVSTGTAAPAEAFPDEPDPDSEGPAEASELALIEVPHGRAKGRQLRDVSDRWLLTALEQWPSDDAFRAALETYTRTERPHLRPEGE